MSEPTDAERAERQTQLDEASREFNAATPTGVSDESGQELYTDGTYRPVQPVVLTATAMSSPPQCFDIASTHSDEAPDLVSSCSSTPKRRKTVTAPTEEPQAEPADVTAAAGPATTAESSAGRGPPTLQAILKRPPSPRGAASPRGPPAPPASTLQLPKLTPKAPPAHLVRERAEQELASTATFGSPLDQMRR